MALFNRSGEVRPISLRRSLMLLVAVCVLPAVALGIYGAFDRFGLYKQQISAQTQRIAESLISEIDRELAGVESGLRVLATSEALQEGDLARFHRMARSAVRSQIVYDYVLTNRDEVQVLNTLVPLGDPLPTFGTPPQLRPVFEEQRTVLTDYFIGPLTGKPAIAMGVPVLNGSGLVQYSLNVGLAPDVLSRVLKRQSLDEGWLAALIDASGTIVARTRSEDEFVGTSAVEPLLAEIRQYRHGTLDTVTKEGRRVVTAYATSGTWGWSVAVGAPEQLLVSQFRTSIVYLTVISATVLLLAGWIAVTIMRRLTRSVEALNAAARSISSGETVELPRIQLVEARAIGEAIVQASRLSREIHYKAYHDALTDLANRPLFYEFLENSLARAQRHGEPFGLLLIDLDGFKMVNDREGHPAGDRILRIAAQRLRTEIRAEDLAARLGGDEFAVLLDNASREITLEIARRIRASLAEPYPDCSIAVSASIGAVTWTPDVKDGRALLERADRALYRVKDQGRNDVQEATP